MRPIHLLLGLIVVLASGASAYVATRLAAVPEPAAPESIAAPATEVPNETGRIQAQQAQEKLSMLAARVDALTSELESLRNSANRAPALASAEKVAPAAELGSVAVTELQRQTVLAVIEEDRARLAAEAEALRMKSEEEQAQRRAGRIAKELNLSPGDETRLAQLLVEGGKKRQEMFETMRNGTFDRDNARTQMESIRTWQTAQLTEAFGASIADQILQSEGGDRIRMFGEGGPGGAAGGFSGNAGGNGGGGRAARRANAGGTAGSNAPVGGGQ